MDPKISYPKFSETPILDCGEAPTEPNLGPSGQPPSIFDPAAYYGAMAQRARGL